MITEIMQRIDERYRDWAHQRMEYRRVMLMTCSRQELAEIGADIGRRLKIARTSAAQG